MSSAILKSIQNIVLRRNVCNVLSAHMQQKYFSMKVYNQQLSISQLTDTGEEIKKRKKTEPIPKITLLSVDNVSIITLEEARNIAKRRGLNLVKVIDLDTKTQRPVYKLMSGAELHAEELKLRQEKKNQRATDALKGEKFVFISCGISEHDLGIHSKKILKWIAKRFEVRVVINGSGSDMGKTEKVYKLLESNIGSNARFIQKRTKGNDMRFQILPPKSDGRDNSGGGD